MIEEKKVSTYRGVVCRHCRQPIPIPAIVINLENAAETRSPEEKHVRVFHLRCRACQKEQLYWSTEVADFEGRPRSVFSRSPKAHDLSRETRRLAKAANA